MAKKCVIFGTTNYTRMMRYNLEHYAGIEVVCYCVGEKYIDQPEYDGLPIVPYEQCAERLSPSDYSFLVGLGYKKMNAPRRQITRELKEKGYAIQGFIHPRACIADNVEMGEGNIVLENTVISYKCVLGDGNIIWNGCNLSHETHLGDYNYLSPGVTLGGETQIKDQCFLGMNSVVRGKKVLADKTLVGAMAFINFGTEENGVYVPPRSYLLEGKNSSEMI